ncbi:hypothetical protein [Litorimonas sp. WD9-15]|uniref:hypothetical protein n=1 Tax=Litorimonas sp. WD9-15 TaxID=3418716 RepID=UPI003CFBC588
MTPTLLKATLITILLSGTASLAQVQTYDGNGQNKAFPGTLTDEANYFGFGRYDQINYPGTVANYGFERQTNGQIHAKKHNGGYNILDNI